MHIGGFAFGTHSPASTYHSGMYTPGMMTDIVREVKEAARIREDALLSRVKSMVEERFWSLGESNSGMIRDIDELKNQIHHLKSDRKESNKRINQLEAENKYMKQVLGSLLNSRTNQIIQENECSKSDSLPRPVSSTFVENVLPNNCLKRNSSNLHHNVLNQQDETKNLISPLLESKSHQQTSNINNFPNVNASQFNGQLRITENLYPNISPNNQAKCSDNEQVWQIEKDTLALRRELEEALASKKDSENRIIALEKVVKKIHLNDKKPILGCFENEKTTYNSNRQLPNSINGSLIRHNSTNGITHANFDFLQNLNNITHITSQTQGAPKLSLAGPITDL